MSDAIVRRIQERGERAAMHLGDGVYASHDGYQIMLRVHREPYEPIHEIALDGSVQECLELYKRRLVELMEERARRIEAGGEWTFQDVPERL